jgi:16S rRNA (guanine966-N2)-methyltransferase
MRIVGGIFRGRPLVSVGKGDEKGRLRPTSDRVRESLFNVLSHGDFPDFEGARVLDLFAGTGALGFEALSRGADHVTFVEKGRVGQGLIRGNIELFQSSKACQLLPKDATRLGVNPGDPFDICFLDPPYGKGLGEAALTVALAGNWFTDQTLIVLEEGKQIALPNGFTLKDVRKYGDTHIHIGCPVLA